LRNLLRIVAKLIVVVFSAIIFYTSWELMGKQFKTGQLSAGLGVHMAVPYFILPLAFGLITLVQGWTLIALVKGLLSGADEEKAEGEKA
jgi:TRAP-type C4-dicarboxylate transport system permease small subunit